MTVILGTSKLTQEHLSRFVRNSSDLRTFGIELENPLTHGDGTGITLSEARELYRVLGRHQNYDPNQDSLTIPFTIDGNNAEFKAEAGFVTIEGATPPAETLAQADHFLTAMYEPLTAITDRMGVKVLGYGIQPVTPPSPQLYSPRERSGAMRSVRERIYHVQEDNSDIATTITAAAQFHIATRTVTDMIRLANLLNGLSPEFLALSANSRICRGVDSGHVDLRSMNYQRYTRTPRIAGIARRFANVEDYYNELYDMPALLLVRDGGYVIIQEDITLGQLANGFRATGMRLGEKNTFAVTFELQDIELIESRVRWEARPKGNTGTVELRVCSMLGTKSDILGLSSIVIGLAENLGKAEELMLRRTVEESRIAKERIAVHGIQGYPQIATFALEMLNIAREGLRMRGEETGYLDSFYRRITNFNTPSDISFGLFQATHISEGMAPFIDFVTFDISR